MNRRINVTIDGDISKMNTDRE